jgi:hypothetical protein
MKKTGMLTTMCHVVSGDRDEKDRMFGTNLPGDRNRSILMFVRVIKSFLSFYNQEYMKNC